MKRKINPEMYCSNCGEKLELIWYCPRCRSKCTEKERTAIYD